MTEERLAMSEQRRIYPLNAMQREMYKDVREHPSVTQYNMTVCVDVPRDKCSPYRMHKACQEVLDKQRYGYSQPERVGNEGRELDDEASHIQCDYEVPPNAEGTIEWLHTAQQADVHDERAERLNYGDCPAGVILHPSHCRRPADGGLCEQADKCCLDEPAGQAALHMVHLVSALDTFFHYFPSLLFQPQSYGFLCKVASLGPCQVPVGGVKTGDFPKIPVLSQCLS